MSTDKFTSGYLPALKAAYSILSEKYIDTQNNDIINRLTAIKKLLDKITNDADIHEIHKTTLQNIMADVLDYMNKIITVKGGNVTVKSRGITDTPTGTLESMQPDLYTKVTAQTRPNEALFNTLQNLFDDYYMNEITTYEAIKRDNNILKNVNIRPPYIDVLVKDLLNWLYKIKAVDLKMCVFSLIQWYLIHNETKGITLTEYDELIKLMPTSDEDVVPFNRDFNSFIVGL